MTESTSIITHRSAAGFARYCFVIRSCLEQDLHEPAELVAPFMEQHRDRLFEMYANSVPAAAVVLALSHEFESVHHA